MAGTRYFAGLIGALIMQAAGAQVVVNEVCASNLNSFPDNNGEFEDWFELYNTTAAPVDIGGWWLSNRAGNPLKWQVPAGTVIPANGRQLFIASKRDEVAGGFIHTNFNLNQTEEDHVLLSDPAGNAIDDFAFAPGNRTKTGHARGRTPDGAGAWALMTTPTPGNANGAGTANYLDRPIFSLAAGYYAAAQNLTLAGPAGSTVRYTLDGSEPTAASTAYAGAIAINTTTVVRAAAFGAAGSQSSFTETSTYFIGVTHTVPILSMAGDDVLTLLNGNGGIQPFGNLEYFGADGVLLGEAVGEFNEHGQDSWAYDQRGVDYVARDQTGYNDAIRHPIFRTKDRPKYQRLIIKAAAGDNFNFGPDQPAHIRDAFVQALSQVGELRLDERSYEPCVLYANGQYWGVYDVREKVDDHDFTRYYYGQDEFNLQMLKTWGGTWEEYGGPQATADWNALRAYINANDMGDPAAFDYVDSQYNWKSLVDYFCLNSYTVCADWLNWNTGWWRGLDPTGEHKKWGYILWDMDATFGHYTNFTGIPDQSPNADPCTAENLPDPGGQGHTLILEKLISENQMVHDYYVNRYADLGNTLFSCDYMIPFLDSLVNLIAPEMPGQIARWGGTMAEWEVNVQLIRDFIEARCVTIEQGMVDCYDLEGPFDVVYKVDPPGSGQVRINSITPGTYPFSGTYYGAINTTLEAQPLDGWEFDRWTLNNHSLDPSLVDTLVTLQFNTTDTIVAHFKPPLRYDVVLMTDPPEVAAITFDGVRHEVLPVTVQVAPEDVDTLRIHPIMYYDFLYWEVKYNTPNHNDTTLRELPITFFQPDTIIAHLRPQEYVYYGANAFSPNGDGLNDTWRPWNNVLALDRYELDVFDRWGRVVFTTTDPYAEWDGKVNGKALPPQVFAYKAKMMEALTKERHEVVGHVTIIR